MRGDLKTKKTFRMLEFNSFPSINLGQNNLSIQFLLNSQSKFSLNLSKKSYIPKNTNTKKKYAINISNIVNLRVKAEVISVIIQ